MRRTIIALICLTLLTSVACGGVAVKPRPAPAPVTLEWRGDGVKETEAFTMTESPWRVDWAASGHQAFGVWLFNAQTGQREKLLVNSLVKTGGGDHSVAHARGKFYLRIEGTDAWAVRVTGR